MKACLLTALTVCAVLTFDAKAAEPDYRLLRLEGSILKWGQPRLGAGARVTYAIANGHTAFRGARNCKAITSPKALISRSRVTRETFTRELRAAFDAWERVADITFRPAADPKRADIVIGAQAKPRGYAFTNVDFAKGPGGVAKLKKSVICLNPERRWKTRFDGNEDIYDLRFTFIHEIGHAIGLDHAKGAGQIMDYHYTEDYRRPQFGDVAGLMRLYGASLAQGGTGHGKPVPPSASAESPKSTARWPRLGLGRM